MEQEKRLRREIANSNERRRMQSINAGFQSLRGLLPHHEGEKLSKAAILQQTSEYIYQLEQDKSKLMNQNSQLKRLMASQGGTANGENNNGLPAPIGGGAYPSSSPHSPAGDVKPIIKRRKTLDGAVESADEGIGNMSPEHSGSGEESRSEIMELRRETVDLRLQLEIERRHRLQLEEHFLQQQQQQQQEIYGMKYEPTETVQVEEETQNCQTVATTPVRIILDETPRCYTLRNNLETIVEAIRHLEGDHLFSDERIKSSPGESSGSDSATGSMEICQSPEGSPTSMQSQSMNEVQINFVSTPPSHVPQPSTSTPVGTTVTSLKHHVLNRIARTPEAEDEPMNLEFRPASRSPSPFSKNQMQQHIRPGVIVVKANSF